VNGTTIGNELVMAGAASFDTLTSFSFEYYSTESAFVGADVQMVVILYANTGAPFNGYATPSTILYNSGLFPLSTPQQYVGGNAATLNFDLSTTPVTVPRDFTLAIEVTGLDSGDSVGMELFDPATVGQNSGDYWLNSGRGWELDHNLAGIPTDFGARFEGVSAVPEPTACGAIAGAWLLALCSLRLWRQRRFWRNI
jgi:hypothetical protein